MTKKAPLRDQWIMAHSLLSPEICHAIGAIVFKWNFCENRARELLFCLSRIRPSIAKEIFSNLENDDIVKRIKLLAPERTASKVILNHLTYILDFYKICNSNRNQLIHFTAILDDGAVRLKRNRKLELEDFNDTLEAARKVAEECDTLLEQMQRFSSALEYGEKQLQPLRERPPLPQRLYPYRKNPKERSPPPRSSLA